ncbi:hypothetical protein N7527_009241 [Penicillium freii]|nr:hypothetical protein N7527_009241 [Penicillium freii]
MSSNTKLELDTETSSSSFLGDLGPPIRSHQQEEFEASEWLLFSNINKQVFSRDFLNSDDSILQRCWNSYDSSQHLLLVKMTVSRAHETAARVFEKHLFFCLIPMGLDDCLRTFGSATCEAENGSAKQPDCQFLPRRLPRGRTAKWPSLVLSESNGDVQMVITIKIGRGLPKIVLESWELVDDRAKRQQVIAIKKGRNNSVYVNGQPLVIRFDKLFLRSPTIRRETDISFHSTMLNKIARDI